MNKLELNIQRFADDNKVSILIETNKKGTGVEDTQKSLSNLSKLTSGLTSGLKKLGVAAGFKELTSGIIKATKTSSDYVETLNLLDAAYQNNTKSIKEFASKISDTLNLDDKTILQSAAHFKTLTQSMGIANETGEKLAKLMTQMTLDVSSLYNLDFDNAQRALQYAMEGRGTSLKQQTGVSVLETSVQTTLDTLGVDAYVEDMNDSEKALARVITMEYQLMASQGDLAQTIEAPANQFRVLGEQVAMVGRNIGNIFLPMMAAILPYVNAVLIVINKLISALATLFGYDPTAWDVDKSNVEAFEGLGSAVDGVGGSMGKAGKAADDLKNKLKGLRGFDKLNVINTPQDNAGGGGAGGGGGGGINPALLKAFDDMFGKYNSMLDGVKTKATQIAEAFMDWLRVFEPLEKPMKEIAGLTYAGLIYVWENVLKPLGSWVAWKLIPQVVKTVAAYLELTYKIGRNLFAIYKNIYELIVYPIARVIGKTIINILKDIERVLTDLSSNKIATGLLTLVVAFKQLNAVAKLASTTLGKTALGKSLLTSYDLIFKNSKGIYDFKNAWGNFITLVTPSFRKYETGMTTMQKATTKFSNVLTGMKSATKGALTALAGFEILKSSFEDIKENGITLGNVLTTLVGAFTLVAGAVVILNTVLTAMGISLMANPIFLIGAAVAAAALAIGTLAAGTKEYNNEVNKGTIAVDKNIEKLRELESQASSNYVAELARLEKAQDYQAILLDTLDVNNKIKAGEEERANKALANLNEQLGTTYKIEDGMIKTEEGLTMTRDSLNESISDTIAKLKLEAYLEAYREEYIQALKTQKAERDALNGKIEISDKKLQELEEQVKSGQKTTTQAAEEALFWEGQKQMAVDDFNKAIKESDTVVKNYEDGVAAAATNSTDKINEQLDKFGLKNSKTLDENLEKTKKNNKLTYDDYLINYINIQSTATDKINAIPNQKTVKIGADTSEIDRAIGIIDTKIGNKRYKMTTSTSGEISLQRYATGGLPSVGQMFIANERGPELVGQIGGQSFVANQNQMLDIIDRKLSNAGGLQNATFVIQVGSEEVARTVLKDLNSMAKSNGKPITINGS